MAKVTKKQLGRRRRMGLLVLILLIAGICFSVSRCVSHFQKKNAEKVSVAEEGAVTTTASTDVTTVPGILYRGTIPMTTAETLPTEPAELPVDSCQLNVTPILQNPELPTGCEVTSLTMALNYAGYAVDKLTMADEYLIRSEPYLTTFGEAFVGSPHDPTAWGCYAPVIVKTAENYITAQNGTETVQNLTGCSLKTLLAEVANGTPVITWATIGMTDKVEERYYWTTPNGDDAVFLVSEHCVLLCGYDLNANTVIVCDPLEGLVSYDMTLFENRYEIMYRQAVVIRESTYDGNAINNESLTIAVGEAD
ncbi:MAG: C39 family peptidase [Ruminococcus sp.]